MIILYYEMQKSLALIIYWLIDAFLCVASLVCPSVVIFVFSVLPQRRNGEALCGSRKPDRSNVECE